MSDWRCHCGTNNFAKRTKCYSCDDFKSKSVSRNDAGEPGDWKCQHCNSPKLNFRSKDRCWTCKELRSKPVVASSSSSSSSATASGPAMESGDWMCTACNSPRFNFRSKSHCFTCGQARGVPPPTSIAAASDQSLDAAAPSYECVICKDGVAEWCNPTCLHICACEKCKDMLAKCPLCQQPAPATGFAKAFFPQ